MKLPARGVWHWATAYFFFLLGSWQIDRAAKTTIHSFVLVHLSASNSLGKPQLLDFYLFTFWVEWFYFGCWRLLGNRGETYQPGNRYPHSRHGPTSPRNLQAQLAKKQEASCGSKICWDKKGAGNGHPIIHKFFFFKNWFLYTQSLPPNIPYPPWSRPGFILIWNLFGVLNIRGMGLYIHSQGFVSVLRMCIMGLMTMPPIPCFDYGRCGKHW